MPDAAGSIAFHPELLAERERTHGSFQEVAFMGQRLRHLFRSQPGWDRLSDVQREALDMMACKLSRVLASGGKEPDHFVDIAGYASLALRGCDR